MDLLAKHLYRKLNFLPLHLVGVPWRMELRSHVCEFATAVMAVALILSDVPTRRTYVVPIAGHRPHLQWLNGHVPGS